MIENEKINKDHALTALEAALTCVEQVNELRQAMTEHIRRLAVAEMLITVLLSESQNLSSTIAKIESAMESGANNLLSSPVPVEEFCIFRSLLNNKLEYLRNLQNKKP